MKYFINKNINFKQLNYVRRENYNQEKPYTLLIVIKIIIIKTSLLEFRSGGKHKFSYIRKRESLLLF